MLLAELGAGAASPAHASPPRFRNARERRKWQTLMAVKALARDPAVEFAEPNYLRQPLAVPNDSFYAFQWHYPLINLPAAWDLETGTANVTVAVIDSGILPGHPDFQGRLIPGFDFVSDPDNAGDGNGIDADPRDPGDGGPSSIFHGTHVAGTIGAASNNVLGVAGVGWNLRLLPLRVCGVFGCAVFDQIEAMRYAAGLPNSSGTVASPPADVINLSLGGPGFSAASQAIVDAVRAAGVIVVAAAGNEASSQPVYPASLAGVVSVSAVGPDRARAPYSSFGANVDVAAPGGNLATDLNGDGFADGVLSLHADDSSGALQYEYLFLQGTSMAAPHVAGVAALMKSANPNLTPALFDQLLSQGDLTDDIGAAGRDDFFGHGLIDAHKAVAAALAASGMPPADNPLLTALPASLNFGSATTALELVLSNAGSGALQVLNVTTSEPWAQAAPLAVDAANLGTWLVTVDRTGLADGVHTATVSLTSNVNAVDVPIIMSVGGAAVGGNVGTVYVVLVDPLSGDTVTGARLDFAAGNYPYLLSGVPAGQYRIVAGTDLDNDGFICDDGEACGEFIARGQPLIIDVAADLAGLDFLVNYEAPVAPASATTGSGTTRAVRRPELTPRHFD
jgi:serine protease